MESVGEIMEELIQKVLKQNGKCPECNEPLYSWRTKNKDGSERCKPTCMKCGYKSLRVQEDLQTERIYNDSLKARALDFFKGGSVISNQSLFDCTLEKFKVVDQETKIALEKAKSYVNAVLLVLSHDHPGLKSNFSRADIATLLQYSSIQTLTLQTVDGSQYLLDRKGKKIPDF